MDVQCPGEGAQQQQALVVNIVPAEVLRFEMVCRVCGNEDESNIQIFGADGQSYELALKMNTYLPVKVADGDGLPSNCCWNCASLILSWHELVVASAENDRKLKELQVVIAKPFVVPAAHPEVEPEAVLPDIDTAIVKKEDEGSAGFKDTVVIKKEDEGSVDSSTTSSLDRKVEAWKSDETTHLTSWQTSQKPTCDVCGKLFSSNSTLFRHRRTVHKGIASPPTPHVTCNTCNKSFTGNRSLTQHKRDSPENATDRTYTCKRCREESKVPKRIRRGPDENSTRFSCKICDGKYFRKSDLIRHIRTKHPQCDDDLPPKRASLAKYKLTVDGKALYECDVCQKRYSKPFSFSVHRRMHATGARSHPCAVCGRRYSTKSSLQRHCTESHIGGPLACRVCGAQFRAKVLLAQHLNIHSDRRPYACGVCGKAFRQSSTLSVHKLSHGADFRFRCDACGKGFRRGNDLKVHAARHRQHAGGHDPLATDPCDVKPAGVFERSREES